MKKLRFGYDGSNHPYGSIEQPGLGLKENGKLVGPTCGEFIDIIQLYNENYIIYKVIEAFNNDSKYIGKYEVRNVLVDLYANGVGVLYVDIKKDYNSSKLESILNFDESQNRLKNGESILDILNVIKSNNYAFDGALNIKVDNDSINVCAINHEVFNYKKELLRRCLSSISDMQEKIELSKKR